MMKRILVFCVLVVEVLACSNAYGAQVATSWLGGTSNDWMVAANWSAGVPQLTVPGTGTVPYLTGAPSILAVIDNVDAGKMQWVALGGKAVGSYTIEMKNAAKLETVGAFYMQAVGGAGAFDVAAVANLNMYNTSKLTIGTYFQTGQMGGTVGGIGTANIRLNNSAEMSCVTNMFLGDNLSHANLYMKDSSKLKAASILLGGGNGLGGPAYMSIQDSATLTLTGGVIISRLVNSVSTFDMSGGTVTAVSAAIEKGIGTINMTDGVMTLTGNLSVLDTASGGTINVSGGTINANDLYLGLGTTGMTVSGTGKVILTGDKMEEVARYIDDGYLTVGAYYLSGGNTYLVPEPASMLLLGLGSLIFVRRNRR